MKTDRFTDIIRRKLESIRPEFTEKDWTRMQASLQQISPPPSGVPNHPFTTTPGTWAAQPWLLAAATVSTVVLVTLSVWQRNQINTLRETVQALNRSTVGRQDSSRVNASPPDLRQPELTAQSVQSADRSSSGGVTSTEPRQMAGVRRDTVYITRYVRVPAQASETDVNTAPRRFESSTDRLAARPQTNSTDRTSSPASPDYSTNQTNALNDRTSTLTKSGIRPRQSNISSAGSSSDDIAQTGSVQTGSRQTGSFNNGSVQTGSRQTRSINNSSSSDASGSSPVDQPLRSRDQLAGQTNPGSTISGDNNVTKGENLASTPVTDAASTDGSSDIAASYERVAGLPLTLGKPDWNRALTLRSRRMRPTRTIIVGGQAAPEKKPESQPTPMLARMRVGVSSDLEAHMWNLGVAGELLLGRHLTLSAGISRATYLSGLFLTDTEFNKSTQRDFRREFARGIDPKRDILNIDTRTIRLQIPVSLGYRVPLSQSLALTPTVGTYLNLSNTENITFYYSDMPRGFSEARYQKDLPNCLVSTITLGTNVEWQRGHWVGQAGPLVSLPTQPGPGLSKNTTIGARLRVLYQF